MHLLTNQREVCIRHKEKNTSNFDMQGKKLCVFRLRTVTSMIVMVRELFENVLRHTLLW